MLKEKTLKFDALNNIVEKGEPALKLNGKVFAENQLKLETIIALEECGAEMTEIK